MDRLEALRKQRDAIAQHLAWIDSEIAREATVTSGKSDWSTPSLPAPTTPPAPTVEPVSKTIEGVSENVLAAAGYEPDPVSLKSDVRKGCLLYTAAAVIAIILFIGIILLWR